MVSRSTGRLGTRLRGAGGSSWSTRASAIASDVDGNGTLPVNSSYSVAPRL
jgi:hypothetical protein